MEIVLLTLVILFIISGILSMYFYLKIFPTIVKQKHNNYPISAMMFYPLKAVTKDLTTIIKEEGLEHTPINKYISIFKLFQKVNITLLAIIVLFIVGVVILTK